MGYTTDFEGRFQLDKPLTEAQRVYLETFSRTRRMLRDAKKCEKRSDPIREAVGLPVGVAGEFFVGSGEDLGQEHSEDVIEYNDPPATQPGLWCQWVPTETGDEIEWDSGEKFYSYVEWLEYLIENFLKPWGYVLSGKVTWRGEEHGDNGTIIVKNNKVSCKK